MGVPFTAVVCAPSKNIPSHSVMPVPPETMATAGTHLHPECFEVMDWQSVFGDACDLLNFTPGPLKRHQAVTWSVSY